MTTDTRTDEEINDAIDAWHEREDITVPLNEWLGWSEEDYFRWIYDSTYRPVRIKPLD